MMGEVESLDLVECCIMNPPAPGHTGTDPMQFTIVDTIRTGDKHAAQLVTVQILHLPESISTISSLDGYYVAKFYDPLYHDHTDEGTDPFFYVDRAYTNEVAAYEMLQPLQGSMIPKFYGSFTLELSIPDRVETRTVRFILIELVPGVCMRELNPADFSRETRQTIMKAIIDIESLMFTHNVFHRDTHPRNVMILPQDPTGLLGIRIVDFGNSRHRVPYWEPWCTSAHAEMFLPGVPISPILRWDQSNRRHKGFSDWIDWDWNSWLDRVYESTKDSITDDMINVWRGRR
jgi:serine/threonine protein kinase